jgi:2-phosphoglycolate phosphatase
MMLRQSLRRSIDTVLFDLDGTLLDTHLDLVAALNTVLVNHGKVPLSADQLRPFVSKGAMVMVCLAFRCSPKSDEARQLWLEMLDVYETDIARHTVLFPGMVQVLEKIETKGWKWGIITNKPGRYTDLLLSELAMPYSPGAVVSGDTLKVKKPAPEPLLLACSELGKPASSCIYIGDDERDIIAGKAAGMPTIAAAYGYIVDEENPEDWNADAIVSSASEISGLIGL